MSKKLVYDVGINNMPGWVGSNPRRRWIYLEWHGMFMRCYSDKFQEKHPTYKGCTVCKRWHTFSNFVADAPLLPGFYLVQEYGFKGICLDKDSLVVGNKEYSPDTCCWLTVSENSHEQMVRNGNPMKDPVSVSKQVRSRDAEMYSKIGKSLGHPVIAISPDGVVTEYFGACECARQLGGSDAVISRSCNASLGSHTVKKGVLKGWTFYWKEDYYAGYNSAP